MEALPTCAPQCCTPNALASRASGSRAWRETPNSTNQGGAKRAQGHWPHALPGHWPRGPVPRKLADHRPVGHQRILLQARLQNRSHASLRTSYAQSSGSDASRQDQRSHRRRARQDPRMPCPCPSELCRRSCVDTLLQLLNRGVTGGLGRQVRHPTPSQSNPRRSARTQCGQRLRRRGCHQATRATRGRCHQATGRGRIHQAT